MQEMGEDEVDFPFRVSPTELAIIESDPQPPCSTVLVGRSGTGKTTCAVYKMWFCWLAFRHHSTEPFHQVCMICCWAGVLLSTGRIPSYACLPRPISGKQAA